MVLFSIFEEKHRKHPLFEDFIDELEKCEMQERLIKPFWNDFMFSNFTWKLKTQTKIIIFKE